MQASTSLLREACNSLTPTIEILTLKTYTIMKPRYINIQSGEVVSSDYVQNIKEDAILSKRDNLSYCLMAGGYGELRY